MIQSANQQPIILVTGASRGIGAATAITLAKKGFRVVINYRQNHDAADQVIDQITQAGGTAMAIQADVADEDAVCILFDEIKNNWGKNTRVS